MNLAIFIPKFVVYLALAGLISVSRLYWPSYVDFIFWAIFTLKLTIDIRVLLIQLFDFSRRGLRTFFLAVFTALMAVSTLVGFVAIFIGLTVWSILPVLAVIGFLASLSFGSKDYGETDYPLSELADPGKAVLDEKPAPFLGVLFFLILAVVGFFLLYTSRSDAVILSPWQVIRPGYVWIFLLATSTLGLLIVSSLKAKWALFLIFLHSLLLHSYLALTHTFIYGADGWRHLAVEKWLAGGFPLTAPLLTDTASVAFDIGELAYAQFWGLALTLNQFFNFNFLQINAWLAPVFWSMFGSVILFEIGRVFGWSKRHALFLAWSGFLPFALQVAGALTLPVNLGLLWFLFGLLLILKKIKRPVFGQRIFLAVFFIFSLFSYSLYLIFLLLGWILAELFLFDFKSNKKIIIGVAVIFSAVLVPVLEISFGYATWQKVDWWWSVKQMLGNFSSWYFASGPRVHDITTGNVLFNQTPLSAFFPNQLTVRLWFMVIGAVSIFALMFFGWYRACRYGRAGERVMAILFFSVFSGYIISRYFLIGERVLSRRLDAIFAFFLLVFFVAAVRYLLERFFRPTRYKNLILVILILAASLFGTAGYSLGPDTVTVGIDDYLAMSYIWQRENQADHFCVIADTYPLLALEAISGRKIIGGGFPINQYFAQPERVFIYNDLLAGAKDSAWRTAGLLTKASSCYLVAPRVSVQSLPARDPSWKIFGQTIVWENATD